MLGEPKGDIRRSPDFQLFLNGPEGKPQNIVMNDGDKSFSVEVDLPGSDVKLALFEKGDSGGFGGGAPPMKEVGNKVLPFKDFDFAQAKVQENAGLLNGASSLDEVQSRLKQAGLWE